MTDQSPLAACASGRRRPVVRAAAAPLDETRIIQGNVLGGFSKPCAAHELNDIADTVGKADDLAVDSHPTPPRGSRRMDNHVRVLIHAFSIGQGGVNRMVSCAARCDGWAGASRPLPTPGLGEHRCSGYR